MHHRHADRSLLPLTCDKGRPAQAGARTNCRQIQQRAHQGKLAERLTDHALGRGARLTQVQRDAGGTWVLASVEDATQDRETQLKERGAARRCGVCKAARDLEAGKISKEEALARAGWDRTNQAQRSVLLDIFSFPKAPGTAPAGRPAPPRPQVPAPRPEPQPPSAPDPGIDAVVDALIQSWRSPSAQPQPEPEPEAAL